MKCTAWCCEMQQVSPVVTLCLLQKKKSKSFVPFYERTLRHYATWQLNDAVAELVEFPTEVSLNIRPCDQLNIPWRPGGVFPLNKPEGSHGEGLRQDLQVLTEGAAGNFSNGMICNFFCHGKDKREKWDEKEMRKEGEGDRGGGGTL